jgi:hypothetical protein
MITPIGTPQTVNVPPVGIIASNVFSAPQLANILEAESLGAQNVREGGNLNAFVDACASVLESADAQGITLDLMGENVLTWFLDPKRDPNPISPGAVGAPLGSRIYCETDKGWFFATWFGAWYLIPYQETINDRPCDYPAFSGCLDAELVIGLRPGALPGGMYWRPAANPDMEPAGNIFGGPDDPTNSPPVSNGNENGNGQESLEGLKPTTVLAIAAAALFFLD